MSYRTKESVENRLQELYRERESVEQSISILEDRLSYNDFEDCR